MTSSTQQSRWSGGIAVLEAEPFLVPELRRQFAGEVEVRPMRLIGDLEAIPPPRVCVLAIESAVDAVLGFLEAARHDPGTACIVQTPTGQSPETEWLLREAGAASVIDSFVRGNELAITCRKLLNTRTQREHPHQDHV